VRLRSEKLVDTGNALREETALGFDLRRGESEPPNFATEIDASRIGH
jgi:hypothetical protein